MKEIEKRELIEQRRKIFEAEAQRADKRTGSFGFLTWPFFIASLIASEEFLAAPFNPAAAEEEENARAALAGAAEQAANDDPPTHDPSKTSGEDETAKEPAASSEPHAGQFDATGLQAQAEDTPNPSTARSEAVAPASGGGGGGGGGDDDADSNHHDASSHHDAHTLIHGSSVNALAAVPLLGSSQLPGGSTLDFVQFNVLGDSFSPPIIGSAGLPGTVGSLSHDVADALAPVEAAVQPLLAPVTDTAGTVSHEVGATAPVEAAVQPVLA
ncbi:hypothetical protein QCM77_44700, partial [Bradyrhizobium sp. SSUT18]